jgi:hypothetical protein
MLHSDDHVDAAPTTVHARLPDEGVCLALTSAMYRNPRAQGEVRQRRRQATLPAAKKPALLATKPTRSSSWAITKPPGLHRRRTARTTPGFPRPGEVDLLQPYAARPQMRQYLECEPNGVPIMTDLARYETGSGDPLVFLHGIGCSRHHWDPVAERLADRYRCLNVDLVGHGDSPRSGPADLSGQVLAITGLLDELELEKPVLVGHSFGGAIATLTPAPVHCGASSTSTSASTPPEPPGTCSCRLSTDSTPGRRL